MIADNRLLLEIADMSFSCLRYMRPSREVDARKRHACTQGMRCPAGTRVRDRRNARGEAHSMGRARAYNGPRARLGMHALASARGDNLAHAKRECARKGCSRRSEIL